MAESMLHPRFPQRTRNVLRRRLLVWHLVNTSPEMRSATFVILARGCRGSAALRRASPCQGEAVAHCSAPRRGSLFGARGALLRILIAIARRLSTLFQGDAWRLWPSKSLTRRRLGGGSLCEHSISATLRRGNLRSGKAAR